MVSVTFRCFTSFGNCDDVDWELDYELSDEDYKRLRKAAEGNDSFQDSKEVEDIYDAVYEAAVDASTRDFIENDPESIEDYLEEDETLDTWRADSVYPIWVEYPNDWIS